VIQANYKFGAMIPDLMMEELLYVLAGAWGKNTSGRSDLHVYNSSPTVDLGFTLSHG
jgi:hypothetical protein